ncbi:MAG: zinc dependent phospholipase C family protein [Clostridium sp.]|jgi:phospholipase C|uniref:zinc dependent phospholipase C family protein n=1 Tax=Clostridium sp. TaxID=1506 RepID=UPI0025C2744C|nr:zinc dependent phospholipase C family protein [Clostridium sp.]MCH3963910.1 zinc dependent phospholipase C family protein [Clostridium sp.]MCI1716111.1 zinc dependent phospholipase C family protein [Clostridium sp.]MCI1800649.1 zinc dependent phospholipase C family protein [Clostridium sp.]MCI1814288.1 zinc dependent phospholipase C family protein [Clostridium sp.]MCI1871187.1 zinc dependent phospholipase C family protein [Clostridium sp.]
MKGKLEKTYGGAVKKLFFAVNPLKKKIMKTNCTVHKFIMIRSIEILKNDGYERQADYFRNNIVNLNLGVSWADQDFKSSNHFYHVSRQKGLYGFSDALTECKKYYSKSISLAKDGDKSKSIFYFGAACHLVQDVTVPQHVNNRLLKSHRKFELWIISKLMSDYSFIAIDGTVRYDSLDEYIKNNAIMANSTYIKNIDIKSRDERYWKIATSILQEAQRTTSGFMLDYYSDMKSLKILH